VRAGTLLGVKGGDGVKTAREASSSPMMVAKDLDRKLAREHPMDSIHSIHSTVMSGRFFSLKSTARQHSKRQPHETTTRDDDR
jgi:hypothetical protein